MNQIVSFDLLYQFLKEYRQVITLQGVAKPAGDAPSLDGLLYLEVPSRWNHAENVIEADTRALAEWLARDPSGLPTFAAVRTALEQMGVAATYDLKHLHSASDPRVYVFVT